MVTSLFALHNGNRGALLLLLFSLEFGMHFREFGSLEKSHLFGKGIRFGGTECNFLTSELRANHVDEEVL